MIDPLSVLVVDDDADKRATVERVLSDRLGRELSRMEMARSYEEAFERLKTGFYDLVILDLLLPAAGGEPSKEVSRALMAAIAAGRLIAPTHVIGLTAFEDVGASERHLYEDKLLALEIYDAVDLGWADRIASKVRYLASSKQAALHLQMNTFDYDVVVIAARHGNEFKPICKRLLGKPDTTAHPMWPGRIAIGTLTHSGCGELKCAVLCVGEMGMASTAVVATQALTVFRPRLIAMLGMCCGFATDRCATPQRLLDAIVVRQVSCWEEGKYIEQIAPGSAEFRNRAKPRMVDDAIRERIDDAVERAEDVIEPALRRLVALRRFVDFRAARSPEVVRSLPQVRYSTLVTGSSVIADEALVHEIIGRHPSAVGLDMEMFGLFTSADRSLGRRSSVIGIKGVADFGDAAKDDEAQVLAVQVACEVFCALLPELGLFGRPD